MKPITKIIVFVIVAFIIVFIITAVLSRKVEAPATATPNQTATSTVSSRSMTYTLVDVAKHKTASDCWTAVGGNVYDLTSFTQKHPGGVENISKVCGIDGTTIFSKQHGSNQNAQAALASLQIGILTQ
jgi:cytochrome b involved in lipid metabolism